MESTLVAFGTLEPTLQIQIVCRHISPLAPDKQPWLKTVHYGGKMLVHGVSTGLPVLPQRASPVASSLGLRVLSTAWRSWTYDCTCVNGSRATSSPESIQPAR